MQRLNKTIIALLIVSLAFNAYTVFKIYALRELIAHDFKNYLETTVEDDLDEMKDALEQMEQGQQWISDIMIKNGGIIGDKQIISVSWQIMDYVIGADVKLYYRKLGEVSFRQLPAISQTAGRFETKLELDQESQPLWVISSWHDGQKNTTSQIDKEPLYRFEYYVVLNDGSHILSSDIQDLNIKKIIQTYSSIDVDITMDNKGIPSVIEFYMDEDKIKPEQLILETYHNGTAKEEVLEINKDKGTTEAWKADKQEFEKIIVKARYGDGKTFQNEIWNRSVIE